MSTRQRLTITLDDRVVVVRGWRAAELIREAGGKPIYAGTVGGWMIDRHRLADVLAYLDERNIAVTVEGSGAADGDGIPCVEPAAADPMEDGGLW